jgi:hypothetical protein
MIPDPIEMIHMPEGRLSLTGETAWAWRDAQVDAARAFAAWCREPGSAAYAVYRAAQDRADAAQEVLARSAA